MNTRRMFARVGGECCQCENVANANANSQLETGNIGNTLILRFLPDFSLWPGMKLRVKVAFDDESPQVVEVPLSNANISEAAPERLKLTQDDFAEVRVQIPAGAASVSITAIDPGAVLDAVCVE